MTLRLLPWLAVAVGLVGADTLLLRAQADELWARARQERGAYLETLRELVAIESGSRDVEGLDRVATLIADRLRALGGQVQFASAGADTYRMEDTPAQIGKAVVATFRGTGTRRILLLAHMDTVYQRGMAAAQPYRVEGDRAYGLGIADDKSGVALIIHAVAMLQSLGSKEYGTLTVLINGDEEISSPGSRNLITRLGSEHDAIFSCEGAGSDDRIRLTTSGNGSVLLKVQGRAAHAGAAPEDGRNALYELAHQILQTRDLSEPSLGMSLNWTIASAGGTRNIIPASASATGDARVTRVRDWDTLEARLRERIARTLVPDTRATLVVERRRPPLEATAASRALANYATAVYGVTGRRLGVTETSGGGGTDAAFAALKTRAPVIEGFGPLGFGAHSDEREFIDLRSVEPRLYLLARLIVDVATGKAPVN
jgi:glutamate carboxypeptidase